ncbi:MAG: DUF3592 domain-containing protein [Phycisphaerales bacterium]
MENVDIALLLFGVAMVASPLETVRQLRQRQSRTRRTEGTVVGHDDQISMMHPGDATRHGPGTRHARIAYEVDGRRFECVSSVGVSWTMHAVGQVVDVAYDPDDLSQGDIVTGRAINALELAVMWGLPIAGVACLAIAAVRLAG